VSAKGELAVLTDVTYIGFRLFDGTLARMTMDGEPRPWMEHVREADWSPDGSTLALIRVLGAKDQLEYPIGKALYDTPGYLSDPRVSPDGRFVAFMEHPFRFDDRGFVKMVDAAGQLTTLAGEHWGEQGLAWSPDGTTVLFSASVASGSESYQPLAVTTSGRPMVRAALSSIGTVFMQDVARDGRWLIVRQDQHSSIRALLPRETDEREFPWLNNAFSPFLSADGRTLLFGDSSQTAGPTYAVAMRKTDGSPAVRLGEGATMGLSPDGKWALGHIVTPPQLVLYPIGPGDVVKLDRGPLERYSSAAWFPDGKRIVACGNEPSHAPRCYAQDVVGGPPKPVTSDGPIRALVAPDNRTLVVGLSDGSTHILPADGGPLRSVPGLATTDSVVAWSHDGTALFVQNSDVPVKLDRVDVATGKRTFVRPFAPPDRTGLVGVLISSLLDDGRYYAYGYTKQLTTLFVVTGAR
jgi:dipeptidyl aminopeptidase/acylaminoacyl peptidase